MKYVFLVLFIFLFGSCIYKAGNRSELMGELLDDKIKPCIFSKNIDSIIENKNLSFPDSLKVWVDYPSEVKYFPNENKILYFKDEPVEFYQVSIYSDIRLQGVHSKKMDTDWVYESNKISKEELIRIKQRIINAIVVPLSNIKDTACK